MIERKEFLNPKRCVIASLFSGQTIDELIAKAQKSQVEGADCITIEIKELQPQYRNLVCFKRLIENIPLPTMFCYYRNGVHDKLDEDQRQEILLMTLEAGASYIDVMGDLYDPSPMEITYNEEAIAKQKTLIDKVHAKGGKVVISSHMQCSRTAEQTLAHLKSVEARGADIVKIVTTVNTAAELQEAFRTTKILKENLKTPFIQLCGGALCRSHRLINPLMGEAVCFAVFNDDLNTVQPQIKEIKTVLGEILPCMQ